jgi:hypothetical protein
MGTSTRVSTDESTGKKTNDHQDSQSWQKASLSVPSRT